MEVSDTLQVGALQVGPRRRSCGRSVSHLASEDRHRIADRLREGLIGRPPTSASSCAGAYRRRCDVVLAGEICSAQTRVIHRDDEDRESSDVARPGATMSDIVGRALPLNGHRLLHAFEDVGCRRFIADLVGRQHVSNDDIIQPDLGIGRCSQTPGVCIVLLEDELGEPPRVVAEPAQDLGAMQLRRHRARPEEWPETRPLVAIEPAAIWELDGIAMDVATQLEHVFVSVDEHTDTSDCRENNTFMLFTRK